MKITLAKSIVLVSLIISKAVYSCDTVQVSMITHLYLGGPEEIEWDLEDEGNGIDIMEGDHIFSLNDSVFSFIACLDTGCYRARARFDHDVEMGLFEIWVTLNGDTLQVYDDIDYGDDDFKYYFPVHTFCEDDDVSVEDVTLEARLYPNPTEDCINVTHPYLKAGALVEVKDNVGNLIFEQTASSDLVYIDCSLWPNGSYLIIVKDENYQSIIACKSIVTH